MSLLLKQLEIEQVISTGKRWEDAQFEKLAEKAWLWRVQYNAHCAHLIAHINQSTAEAETSIELIKSALFMAELLESLHERLNEHTTSEQFKQDKQRLKLLLKQTTVNTTSYGFDFAGQLQTVTFNGDSVRILTGNARRIGLGLTLYPETFGHHLTLTEQCVNCFGPVLSIAGFLIYLPRSIVNSIILSLRYTEKNAIPLKHRLQAHAEINDRLFNLMNDFPSILSGFITVCLLTTANLWLAAYLTATVKFCEIIFSAYKNYYDVSRLHTMRATYDVHQNLSDIDNAYLKHLDQSIAYIQGLRNVNTAMHSLLLLCLICFIPPILTLHPAIPIIAASFAIVLVCLRFSSFRDYWIEAPAPKNQLQNLSFFQPPSVPSIDNQAPPCLNQIQPKSNPEHMP